MGKDLKGKELGVGISQQKDGLYMARFTNKRGKRVVKRFKKLQECRQWIANAVYDNEHSDICFSSDMTVNAWYEYWIGLKRRVLRNNTAYNYEYYYKRYVEQVIGRMLLSEVTPLLCQRILLNMADKGLKTSTIKLVKTFMSNFFESARENGIIASNPCAVKIETRIGKDSEERMALTIDEQKKLLGAVADRERELQFRFILQTGIRISELNGLKWSDIDFEKKVMSIERILSYNQKTKKFEFGPPKSKAGIRTIPLTEEAIKLLKKQKEKNKRIKVVPIEWSDLIFLSKKGTPIHTTAYDRTLREICKKIGMRCISVHILRHTFATRCIEGGMLPKILQKILGHSNITMTMNLYVHATEDEKIKEIEKVAFALCV